MRLRRMCGKCKNMKDHKEFHKDRRGRDGLQPYCKVCQNKMVKAWQSRNPDRVRATTRAWMAANPERVRANSRKYRIKQKYGLTVEEYDNLITQACCICRKNPEKPHLDHCHRTGKVRGVLCGTCNTGLGMFKDDPELLRRAIKYLSR